MSTVVWFWFSKCKYFLHLSYRTKIGNALITCGREESIFNTIKRFYIGKNFIVKKKTIKKSHYWQPLELAKLIRLQIINYKAFYHNAKSLHQCRENSCCLCADVTEVLEIYSFYIQ